MPVDIELGDCVKIPDGRIARVRNVSDDVYEVRVRRKTGKSNQFLDFQKEELIKVTCPKGWMSPEGYMRYLKITLEKMRIRVKKVRAKN
jgi:hypothetical protein